MAKEVVFVCTGNICRSPMAEYLFRHRMRNQDGWNAVSAGVFAMHGSRASENSVIALSEWDVDLTPHQSQPLTPELVEAADLIVVMTGGHRRDVVAHYPDAAGKVRLLTSFGPGTDARDVSDPIGLSLHVYRSVRDQIDSALADLILWIKEQES